MKLASIIRDHEDTRRMQRDIDNEIRWNENNRLHFNDDKCYIFSAYRHNSSFIQANYIMGDHNIERVEETTDLGVRFNKSYHPGHHIEWQWKLDRWSDASSIFRTEISPKRLNEFFMWRTWVQGWNTHRQYGTQLHRYTKMISNPYRNSSLSIYCKAESMRRLIDWHHTKIVVSYWNCKVWRRDGLLRTPRSLSKFIGATSRTTSFHRTSFAMRALTTFENQHDSYW